MCDVYLRHALESGESIYLAHSALLTYHSLRLREDFRNSLTKYCKNKISVNSQAPVSPELAIRSVFRLSRLSDSSYSKTVKKYTPQIEYRGFFRIIHFYVRRLWNPQNAVENFRLRFYLLWCLLVLIFWRLSELISVQ